MMPSFNRVEFSCPPNWCWIHSPINFNNRNIVQIVQKLAKIRFTPQNYQKIAKKPIANLFHTSKFMLTAATWNHGYNHMKLVEIAGSCCSILRYFNIPWVDLTGHRWRWSASCTQNVNFSIAGLVGFSHSPSLLTGSLHSIEPRPSDDCASVERTSYISVILNTIQYEWRNQVNNFNSLKMT